MAEATFESTNLKYESALNTALAQFRTLLASHSSRSWKPLQPSISPNSDSIGKGKSKELLNGIGTIEHGSQVQLHKKHSKGGADIIRATVEFGVGEQVDLENFKAVLQTAEVREAWDKLVEHAHAIEQLDPQTRISKTDYRLGWPASPRDTITISKTFSDQNTLIDISTSLPRSADEPAYLRPAPPYVRSHVHLLAWSIQLPPHRNNSSAGTESKARITVFWQWSLKGAVFATHHQQIAQLLSGFLEFVRDKGDQIPLISSYGKNLELGSSSFDRGQETLMCEYSIISDDEQDAKAEGSIKDVDELSKQKERRRLERAIEFSLASTQGWDISVGIKGQGEGVDVNWTAVAEAAADASGRITLRISHAKIVRSDHLVRGHVAIQRLAGGKMLRINGETTKAHTIEPRNPSSLSRQMLDDTASIGNASFATTSSSDAGTSTISTTTSTGFPSIPSPATTEIMSLLRRNYIYFTSLLQEPEAKWRHVSDSHGVTVTQLNSIDPTLTIYRAEATFVGVGVWDVFSTICTPGARMQWDKTLEDAVLLDDVNELSSLWHIKTRTAWPVAPRDSVTIRTSYKSPSSVHIFSFSTDDTKLFPSIPPPIAPTIRTQTDLYGWAIEALSPTTTQITLLDQSDPKGWSNKSWTPTQMVNAVAGVGDFSIKFGGPPVVTRLLGAKATLSKYDHEKGMLKTEYKAAAISPATLSLPGEEVEPHLSLGSNGDIPSLIECEIRCDCNTWAASIDIVIDPPPAKVSCLSRHRLSSGGGLWITIEHDPAAIGTDRILVVVRKGSGGREKGSVTVNGSKAKVDVESLHDDEVKLLSKRKRVKASPIPLDQYPTHGPRQWRSPPSLSGRTSPAPTPSATPIEDPMKHATATSPLAQELTNGNKTIPIESPASPAPAKPILAAPEQALEALAWLQTFHAEQGPELTDPAPGWAIVSERTGTTVRKKVIPRISETLPVYRGDKIVQGLTADEIASIVSSLGCRKSWDERIETATPLATYGHGVSTAVLTTKPTFPFKGRIFHIASVNAHVRVPSASASASTSNVIFVASASYTPDQTFDPAKVNPAGLLPAQTLLEGWILETLDPYTSSVLAIPSTRCTYVACVDHAGSVPSALTGVLNANLARLINAVESLGKTKGPLPRLWTPDAGLTIEGPLNDDGEQECIWKLSNIGTSSTLLTSDFTIDDATFRSLYRITAPPVPPAATRVKHTSTPSKSSITPSTPVGSIIKSELPRSASLTFGSQTSASLSKTASQDLSRKPSNASLSGLATENRSKSPTEASKLAPTVSDLVAAELIIDLKQFPHGYSIVCSSSLLPMDPTEPLSLEPLRSLATRQVPLRATAHEAPLPSILSASLDSSKRNNHLIRILVPTAAVTHPVQDPLREGKPALPAWFKNLSEAGAIVDVRVVPLPFDSSLKGGLRATFNGEVIPVAGKKESRAVVSRMEDEDWYPAGAKISRVSRKRKAIDEDALVANLPPQFQRPAAVAVRLLAPIISPSIVEDEFPDPKSPGMTTPRDEEKSPIASQTLGATLQVPRRDTVSSDSSGSGPLLGILGAYPLSRLSSSMATTSPATTGQTKTDRRTYTLNFVLLVALISFLLGSLLRSLLTPADFIIYPSQEQQDQQVERVLMQAFDPDRRWREARRLVEMRSFFFSRWDLIVAVVRRS